MVKGDGHHPSGSKSWLRTAAADTMNLEILSDTANHTGRSSGSVQARRGSLLRGC